MEPANIADSNKRLLVSIAGHDGSSRIDEWIPPLDRAENVFASVIGQIPQSKHILKLIV